ncbi:Rv0361 family membrane protein [Micromonospora sp. H33]|uniref:Rv0361 family membrane protein n=1 Tax=Micromonospora sp. H33 TaxID=3452215 RepID=UPI003F8C18B0
MGAEQPWSRPARPRRTVRAGLVFAGVGVGLCCVGVAGLGARNLQVVTQASGPVRETADGFLRSVTAGDTDGAYDRLCADARTRWSQLGFTSWVRTPPTVSDYEIVDVSVATRRGRPQGTVTVRLTRDSGMTEQREMTVVKEDGGWRVCGDPY